VPGRRIKALGSVALLGATGTDALYSNTTGSTNIAVGYKAGYNLTTGSNNIDIGSPGVAAESGIIRIGTITGTTSTQSAAYVAGIYGVKTGTAGTAVFIDSSGQLGTVSSSRRYKEDVQPMEDVKVYPELMIRDEKGRIDGVRYDELAPMLLNEVQKQQQKNAAQEVEIRDLKQQVAELKDLKQELRAALLKLNAKEELIAHR
jgi:hypothetical protein